MIGLEDLLLANLLVRRNLVAPAEARAALVELDRVPQRTDLWGRLASRTPALAGPDMRERAMATVQRYLFAKQEAAFLARLRASQAVPGPVVEGLIAEQRSAGLAWSLAERLTRDGKLSPVRCAVLQKEAAAELKKHEAQVVAKHRSTGFAETIGQGFATRPSGEFPALATSGEVLPAQFGIPAPPPASEDDASEKTIKLPARASTEEASEKTVVFGPGQARQDEPAEGDKTIKLPAQGSPAASAARRAPPPGPLAAGATLAGKYTVVAELGRGAMGVVYRARAHERQGAEVALKAVAPKPGSTAAQDEVVQRFKREILTASLVDHENVCAVYDAGAAEGGMTYLAMELIEGETLRDLLGREAPLAPGRAVSCLEQILSGVVACHQAKVIHRDLKPENVRVTKKDGKELLKIVDFGIARLISTDSVVSERVFVTVKGTLSGTPSYVAPELFMEPDLVDEKCDLYSVGVIFYELLTGRLPYKSTSIREILKDSIEGRPTPLAEAVPGHDISPEVERFLFRLLEKDTQLRYQSAKEALEALRATRAPAKAPAAEAAKKKGCFARLFGR